MLTDPQVKNAKPRHKAYKLFDEKGLFVLVYPNGKRGFRFRYRFGGREKLISFGSYPDTKLKSARDQRDAAREQLRKGIDPSAVRQVEKAGQGDTFDAVAREWVAAGCPGGGKKTAITENTAEQLKTRLHKYLLPYVGRWPITDVSAPELLKVLRRIESKGLHETAHRVRALASRVFRYAIATGRAERDPATDLQGTLTPIGTQHFAAITDPKRIGELLRAIDTYQGQPSTTFALKIAPYVFVRPTELRAAEWREFDLEAAEWRIPAERMKMAREHIVPLSRQVLELLEELRPFTGHTPLLFPALRSTTRPISENTVNAALRRLDFAKDEMTGHGFRTMASTRLNEMGWAPDVIELQLAHKDQNKVRDAYNRAQRLPERRKMMQAWSGFLDGLRTDKKGKVRAIRT